LPNSVPYSTAKAGLIGMAKALTAEIEAAEHDVDIRVNVVWPTADTRRGGPARALFGDLAAPEMVAAVTAFLASRQCRLSGEVVLAGASHVAKMFIGTTRGWAKCSPDLSPEDVAVHLAEAFDMEGFSIPESVMDATMHIAECALGDRKEAEARLSAWYATFQPSTSAQTP
jgi:NAD(P)-dependent dehydrogenase (short-subunit alcohol dehydrogenase family)